jgi:glycosyltransferase involved in cell wall biosynthesis
MGEKMIKVSVIVPVYNMEKYLEKCMDSLLNQTLEEIEIIVIDDGSTDKSPEILERYKTLSDKIICVRKENGGRSDARNDGLPYATGEYIGYLDSDDYVDSEMYEVMYNKASEQGSDIVECNLHHTYAGYEDTEIVAKYYTQEELLCNGRGVAWNKIYKRDWLVEANVKFPKGLIYEDMAFFWKLVPYIRKYDYVDIAPVHYVQRSSSINNASSERTMHVFDILRDVTDFYKEHGFYEQYEKEFEYLYARILLCSSFERMCRIPDKNIRKRALKLNWRELADNFPEWRSNTTLNNEKGRNALFMKMQNPLTYRIFSAVFPPVFRIRDRKKVRL